MPKFEVLYGDQLPPMEIEADGTVVTDGILKFFTVDDPAPNSLSERKVFIQFKNWIYVRVLPTEKWERVCEKCGEDMVMTYRDKEGGIADTNGVVGTRTFTCKCGHVETEEVKV